MVRRRTRWPRWVLGGVAGLIVAGVLLGAGAWRVSRLRCFALVGEAICRVETTKPAVALTFDDGPTPLGVDYVLPLLRQHGAHATFFLIGEEAERRPELVRTIAAAGHEIGNHSFSHRRMLGRSMSFYENEIGRTQAVLRHDDVAPRSFRPPNGKKLIGLPLAVQRARLRLVMWDVEDPATSNPARFATEVVSQARPGSIILIHAMYPANATARRALPAILTGLEGKGLQVVSVEELIERRQARAPH